MSDWEWKEEFTHFPANLCVKPRTWSIEKYFPGPDARYSGDFLTIPSNSVKEYAENLKKTWDKFQSLYQGLKGEKDVKVAGFGMCEIHINYFSGTGITLMKYHGLIGDAKTLEAYLQDLASAPERAALIQERLKGIQRPK